MHTYTYLTLMHIGIGTATYIQAYAHPCICFKHTHMFTHIYKIRHKSHTITNSCTWMHPPPPSISFPLAPSHARTHARKHIHTQTHTRTRTHTHTLIFKGIRVSNHYHIYLVGYVKLFMFLPFPFISISFLQDHQIFNIQLAVCWLCNSDT